LKIEIIDTFIKDLKIIIPEIFEDHRGYFFECYNKPLLDQHGLNYDFIQDNQSKSQYGTIRGLHFQVNPFAQAKLVRVMEGEIIDVAIDLRTSSQTFGNAFSLILSADNRKQLLIPKGFAHGFGVLSNFAIVQYKIDNVYNPKSERGIIFNDPNFRIEWGIPKKDIILSEKDKKNEYFERTRTYFE
jgi:dTDP-4-dehydrorhamnose 3,5-epimerase